MTGEVRNRPAPDVEGERRAPEVERNATHERRASDRESRAGARERRAVTRALERERRRVAAEVHDLVMQDLSLALANARTLAADLDEMPRACMVVSAGERALAGARAVLGGLTDFDGEAYEPLVNAIEASARIAARGARLCFDATGVPCSAQADRQVRDALLHVVREAVTNASKHSGTETIVVSLSHDGCWRLTVSDDGAGFDAKGRTDEDEGFGLRSMRAHVQALDGTLNVTGTAASGTTVEAVLP